MPDSRVLPSTPALRDALFEPRGVALIGASGDPAKNTARPQRFMRQRGFAGAVVPINPGRSEVLGIRAWPSVADAPGPIDHAFIMVPAHAVPAAIEDCAAAGVTVATLFSDGFAETGAEGRERQEQLVTRARELGVRLIGPNSIGVINLATGLSLTVSATLEAGDYPVGTTSVVSQSGTMLGALLSRGAERGIGFGRLVSIGNESDVSVAELVDALVEDAGTEVIALFVETLRHPAALAAAARRAFDAGKPVVAYLLGRSEAGQALAVSHSGALAGSARAAEAFFQAHGIIQVDMLESLFETAPLVRGRRPGRGRRAAVITTTGGGAATVADRLGTLGVELLHAPAIVVEEMAAIGVDVSRAPIIDLTLAGARPGVYGKALAHLLADERCDAVVAVVGSSAQHHPEIAVAPIVAAGRTDKPVAAFMVPEANRSLRMLAEAGVAAFRTPESCAGALSAFLAWRAPRADVPADPRVEAVAGLLAGHAGTRDEAFGLAAFETLGVPVVARTEVGVDAPLTHGLAYPVVAKLVSPDLPHKSDAGAVTIGIVDDEALVLAVRQMSERVRERAPDARIEGVLVEQMCEGIGEAIVGVRRDPAAGPIVTVGLGGVMTEVFADAAVAAAPVDHATAVGMIDSVRGFGLLLGLRGRPRGDLDALAAFVARFSQLALLEQVIEAEANPVIVGRDGEGVTAVDALLVLAQEGTGL